MFLVLSSKITSVEFVESLKEFKLSSALARRALTLGNSDAINFLAAEDDSFYSHKE